MIHIPVAQGPTPLGNHEQNRWAMSSPVIFDIVGSQGLGTSLLRFTIAADGVGDDVYDEASDRSAQ